jgi:predicted TIM-barrel fold metal-dependent hydrolase
MAGNIGIRLERIKQMGAGEMEGPGSGNNQIVDAHVHLLPGKLSEKVRAFFHEHIESELAFPLDHATVLEMLAGSGIGMVWSLPYAHKPGVAAGLNAASAETARRFAGNAVQVVGGATVHPGDSDTRAVVREAREKYDLKVLKLHCSVGDFEADDPRLDGVWQFVGERRMPVVVHLGHAVSGRTAASELEPLHRLVNRFPLVRVIIAHCGHRAGPQALDLVEQYPGIYADLTPVVTEPVEVPAGRVNKLADKLLFGSDAPNTAIGIEECLAHIRSMGLSRAAEAAILGGTARRLLSEVL